MKKVLIASLIAMMAATTACTQKKADHSAPAAPPINNGDNKPVDGRLKDDPNLDIQTRVIRNVSYNVILQTYKDMETRTAELAALTNELARQPSQQLLEQAQDQWKKCRQAWEGTESFLFGPVESLGIDPLIDTWPLNKSDLNAMLSSGQPLTVEYISNLGTNVQGFHTVEYLLFGNGETTNTRSVAQMSPREMQYLASTAELLADAAHRLSVSWSTQYDPDDANTPGYVQMIMNPGSPHNNFYASQTAVFLELANGMSGIVGEVGNSKMAAPMGGNAGAADTTKVESPFSWNSLTDFMNNIRSVQAVYTGTYDGYTGPGLKNIVARKDAVLAETIDAQIALSIQKISDVGGPDKMPFRYAIKDAQGRVRIQAAIDQLHKLLKLLNQKMIPLLSN